MSFSFKGTIPASKSLMNRALICSSYTNGLHLEGSSSCDDVVKMQAAISKLLKFTSSSQKATDSLEHTVEYDCGAAGTVLRFLSLRLSRLPGKHVLKGTERLMQRPQKDLLELFDRLSVKYQLEKNRLILHSEGWKNTDKPIVVHRNVSSQFASGLILNAWLLEHDLVLELDGESMSEGYLSMTVELVKKLGMFIDYKNQKIIINKNSKVSKNNYVVESDLSSLFAVAAFSVLNGPAQFENFPLPSLQPDSEFLNFFQQMEISYELSNKSNKESYLKVFPTKNFNGLKASLNSCPDLFPVLATLCAFAKTDSHLHSAPQLVHKESDRIQKTSELLSYLGIKNEPLSDGMKIYPSKVTNVITNVKPFSYDTDHDHRLAFAAGLVSSQKIPISILHPEVVDKSFPEFWKTIGLNPNS